VVNTTMKTHRRRPAEPITMYHARLSHATAGRVSSGSSSCGSGPTCGGRVRKRASRRQPSLSQVPVAGGCCGLPVQVMLSSGWAGVIVVFYAIGLACGEFCHQIGLVGLPPPCEPRERRRLGVCARVCRIEEGSEGWKRRIRFGGYVGGIHGSRKHESDCNSIAICGSNGFSTEPRASPTEITR